jgi:hypothetical protein
MTVSVLVPYRPVDDQRERVFRWVLERWGATRDLFTEQLDIVVGHLSPEGPWRKGLAYHEALGRATGDICIFTDADTWIPSLPAAVNLLISGEVPWVRGCDEVKRLSQEATEAVLTEDVAPAKAYSMHGGHEPTYAHDAAGAGTVVWRKDAETIPIDPRFAGWGHEDSAWAKALATLLGPGATLDDSPCYHLWHEPQDRQSRRRGSDESWRLWRRYVKAEKDEDAMQALVEEALAALPPHTLDSPRS